MSDDEQPQTSFPRGGAGPPQALPKGANVALVVISVLALGAMLGLMAWVFAL